MKNEYKFGVKGQERKSFVGAFSEILNAPVKYLGAPTFAYEVGDYVIDKEGTVTGEYDLNLFVGLAERGYEPEPSKTFHLITPRGTLLIQERFDTAAEAEAAGYSNYFHHEGRDVYIKTAPDGQTEHSKHFALVGAPFAPEAPVEESPEVTVPEAEAPTEADTGRLTIEVPVLGFTPEHIENLNKMVLAKESLLKKVLGIDELPIRMGLDTIQFPWFPAEPTENAAYYVQFIHALCETAREKKRVTAKAKDLNGTSEKFAMRVFLINLGLIGSEYKNCRALMTQGLTGNASFADDAKYKAMQESRRKAAPALVTAEEALVEDAPAKTAPVEEAAPAAEESEAGLDD